MSNNYYEYLANFNNVSKEQIGGGVYVDNALNRRLGRVGQSYGKKTNKVEKPKKLLLIRNLRGLEIINL